MRPESLGWLWTHLCKALLGDSPARRWDDVVELTYVASIEVEISEPDMDLGEETHCPEEVAISDR